MSSVRSGSRQTVQTVAIKTALPLANLEKRLMIADFLCKKLIGKCMRAADSTSALQASRVKRGAVCTQHTHSILSLLVERSHPHVIAAVQFLFHWTGAGSHY